MPAIWISIGSNMQRKRHIREAMKLLSGELGKALVSPVYETAAEGFEGPAFYNLVAGFNTDHSAEELVKLFTNIEDRLGRRRGDNKFDSRTIDIDLLTYGVAVTSALGKNLPRNDILDYAFVLKPLVDLAPDELHPETGISYGEHWHQFSPKPEGMREVDSAFLE